MRTIVNDNSVSKVSKKMAGKQIWNPDFQKGLLASVFHSPESIVNTIKASGITEEHFLPALGVIYSTFREFVENKRPIDIITITNYLDRTGKLDSAGGAATITELFTFVPTGSNAYYYLEGFKEDVARSMIYAESLKIAEDILTAPTGEEITSFATNAYRGALELLHNSPKKDSNDTLLSGYLDILEDMATGKQGSVRFIPTPFDGLNFQIDGTSPGEATGIIGPESSGKSIFAKQFVANLCFNHDMPGQVFTGEMPYQQWMNRLLCDLGDINFRNLRNGKLEPWEANKILPLLERIKKAGLSVYDKKRIKFTDVAIEQEIRRLAKQGKCKWVLLDMLQHVRYTGKDKLRTDEQIGRISEMIKEVAVEYGLHFFVVCKANEDGGVRNSGEPQYDFDNLLNLVVRKDEKKNRIYTEKIMISKWRDAERGNALHVEMEGKHCRFKDLTVIPKT